MKLLVLLGGLLTSLNSPTISRKIEVPTKEGCEYVYIWTLYDSCGILRSTSDTLYIGSTLPCTMHYFNYIP